MTHSFYIRCYDSYHIRIRIYCVERNSHFRLYIIFWDRRGRDRMVVGFTTEYAIIAYPH